MFNLFIQLYFLFIHWIADFVLQTDSQAKGKSTSIKMLLKHTVTYGLCILAASYYLQAWDMFGGTILVCISFIYTRSICKSYNYRLLYK